MSPHSSILRERLNARRPIHCFKSNFPTIVAPQLLGEIGIDCLWLDQEHLPTDSLTLYSLIVAAHGVAADAVVRVPNGDLSTAVRMLDAGADAIMYPRVRSAAEVQTLVQHLRFAPIGDRGVDTMVFANRFGARNVDDFTAFANANDVIIVQIETREALRQVDEIAAVPGIDVLFVGLGDLSRDLGIPCDPTNEQLDSAVKHVAAAAERHGVAWGMPALSIEHAQQLLAAGALFVSHGSDTSLLKGAVTNLRKQMESIGFKFGR
jgi:4-hydroxy-2-oxoheptanedioate aldolase